MEKFVHGLMGAPYSSSQANLTTEFKYVKDHGLILAKENNGKEFSIWKRPLRIDLYGLTSFVSGVFSNLDFNFDDKIIDGENEIAESKLYLGYEDFTIKDISKSLPLFTREVPHLKDYRISQEDLLKIKSFINNDFDEVECSFERTLFNEKNGHRQIKKYKELSNLKKEFLPYSQLDRFGNEDRFGQFFHSSFISLKGIPSEVRKASLGLLSLCYNENLKTSNFQEEGIFEKFKVNDLNLNYDLKSENWSYHQWLPSKIRGG